MRRRARCRWLVTRCAASPQLTAVTRTLVTPTQRLPLRNRTFQNALPRRAQNAEWNARRRSTFRLIYVATIRLIGLATQHLVGQVYQLGTPTYQGLLVWSVGTLPLLLLGRSRYLAVLAVLGLWSTHALSLEAFRRAAHAVMALDSQGRAHVRQLLIDGDPIAGKAAPAP